VTTLAPGLVRAARHVSQFHEREAVVAWWLAWTRPILSRLTPGRRRTLLAVGAVLEGIRETVHEARGNASILGPGGILEGALLVALIASVFAAVFVAAKHYARLPSAVRHRPQVSLHLLFWVPLAVFWLVPADAGRGRLLLGAFVILFPAVVWRLGYMLLSGQRGRMAGTTVRDHVMYTFPVWGGSNTPYGKGLDYLARSEARTDEALARSQLAGLKLWLLSLCLRGLLALLDGLVYGEPRSAVTAALGGLHLGLQPFTTLVNEPGAASLVTVWLSLYADLVRRVLKIAIGGHEIVALLRLAGFHVFRNTYKPLLAESVVGFWNRYYYYFKELLAEFFFYPTFVRWFKRAPQLRMFAATMMAACVGNMYYHLLQRQGPLLRGDLAGVLPWVQTRGFYCLLLAIGIYVSMRREQGRRGQASGATGGLAARYRRILGVWTFYSLIHIWGAGGGGSFAQRTRFFLSLFGLG
jgi:hypothetical protein